MPNPAGLCLSGGAAARRTCSCIALAVALAACGGDDLQDLPTVFGGSDRPATLHVPEPLESGKQYPLIMILHGYSANGVLQEAFFGLRAEVDAGNALEIAPDGLVDSMGNEYWNADPACCDYDHTNPDDSGYLGTMLDDIIATYPVDQSRVFVVGHSNGGYMAYRLACDHADTITAIGVLAGIVPSVSTECPPSQPVNVLHMHGTADDEVPYPQTATYAGALGSVEEWAGYDHCGSAMTAGGTLDLDASVPGAETQISSFTCPSPNAVELWTLNGSSHIPSPTPAFEPTLYAWLTSHPR
jgi:polyhydroxybutyrate depolymerase